MDDQSPAPVSKADYVLAQIRSDIREGRIVPGQPLRQADLAGKYGVSATPVREALRTLESEGLVSYSAHKGATVRELEPVNVVQLYRIRSAMEGIAARMAAENATPDSIVTLTERHLAIDEAIGSVKPVELARLNRAFHFAIYEAASAFVADLIRPLWTFIPPSLSLWDDGSLARRLSQQHADILTAIRDGDPSQAQSLMEEHVALAGEQRLHSQC